MEPDTLNRRERPNTLVAIPSSLGWMALITSGDLLKQLTFGHSSAEDAIEELDPELLEKAESATQDEQLVGRLQAYAAGTAVDFRDVLVDFGLLKEFNRQVMHHCRQIPYGETLTYTQLAAKAGSPQAARAVGRLMAANRVPLIVPCHRVVSAGGRLGGFSAPGGVDVKKRMLELEFSSRRRGL